MFKYDAQDYPYASKRHVVYAKNGMSCVGNPSGAAAGLQVLLKGGNAIDAAVAIACAQPVVEPTGNGLGADCFALIWYKGKLYGINGSGPLPKAASIAKLKERGFESIPPYGVEPIDVPGAVGGWMAMHERFGHLPLEEVMQPAIDYAENGYPVSPNISRLWEEAYKNYSKYRDRPEFKGWFDTFAPNDTWLRPGDIFKSHDMAETLREIARTKGESFYRGALAQKIDAFMKEHTPVEHIFALVYAFQMFAGLAHIHGRGVMHRDMSPDNLVVDPSTGKLKIIDFGFAKVATGNSESVPYLTERPYRAHNA